MRHLGHSLFAAIAVLGHRASVDYETKAPEPRPEPAELPFVMPKGIRHPDRYLKSLARRKRKAQRP